MKITTKPYGKDHLQRDVTQYTITNASGASVSVLDLGGIVTRLVMPDRDGKLDDVVLGYDDAMSYMQNSGYLGALIGRVGNRIGGAAFTLEGIDYTLDANIGSNTLHGGVDGFNKRMFAVTKSDTSLTLSLISPDGDSGFPGNLTLEATYTLSEDNAFSITYRATTDKSTIVNLTNHSYFNLDGQDAPDIKNLTLQMFADCVTQTGETLIPTGALLPTAGLVYEFKSPTRIGDVLDHPDTEMKNAGGVDFNYCAGRDREEKLIATLYSPKTGREMKTYTDLPGVQIYTGQGLNQTGKNGIHYHAYAGVCLETQRYPDAIHHPQFPSIVLRPQEVYLTKTTYRFSVR